MREHQLSSPRLLLAHLGIPAIRTDPFIQPRPLSGRMPLTVERPRAVEPTPACELCGLDELLHLSGPRPQGWEYLPHLLGTGGLKGLADAGGRLESLPFSGSYSLLSGPRIYSPVHKLPVSEHPQTCEAALAAQPEQRMWERNM